MSTMTMLEAIGAALREEMTRDPSVIIIGEDVRRRGGMRGASAGLWEEFGSSRVIDMPVSEMAIAGACNGAAMSGLRPVGEIFFGDLIALMADNVVNSAAKLHFATDGALKAPFVLRGGDSSRLDGGPHQDTLGAWFAHVPGLKVVIPATPADAKGLLVAAIRDDNPVIVLEPQRLYDVEGTVPDGDGVVPIGVAEVKAGGDDITLSCVGHAVHLALEAHGRWREKGVGVEVLDLRTLRPLDVAAIRRSVGKTGRLIVAHEGWASYGIGAEVVACVSDGPELLLRAPARRVGTLETHIPASPRLAAAFLPDAGRLDGAIAEVMA
jgi:pyruvate/2-oxoglutarate/acetoin dehydrogenase E1 component